MALKLVELLSDRRFALTLRVGENAVNRSIRWVHTVEVIEQVGSPFLRRGELVLTEGLWHTGEDDSRRFVEYLTSGHVTGLGYGVTRREPEAPSDLIEACKKAGLPLFEIPESVAFIALSQAVIAALARERETQLVDTVRRNQQMMSALRQGSSYAGIIGVLAEEHTLAPWLLGVSGRVLAVTNDSPTDDEIETVRAALPEIGRIPVTLRVGAGHIAVFPINSVAEPDRHDSFLICRKATHALDGEERSAVDQALAFLSLEFARIDAETSIRSSFASELIDLINEGESRLVETRTRLRTFGLNPDGELAVICIVSTASRSSQREVADVVETFIRARGHDSVVAVSADELIAVLAGKLSETSLRDLAEQLHELVSGRTGQSSLSLGVGHMVTGVSDLRRSLSNARYAANLAKMGGDSIRTTSASEVPSHSVLLALQPEATLESFRTSVLAPLEHYDQRHRTRLVQTLEVFLDSGGHWKKTAECLHVHVNTLRHRIARIEEITDRSLSRMGDLVDLYLALRIQNGLTPER